jgi:hypothetical protein
MFSSSSILHLPALGSDHNPLLLDTVHSDHSLSRPFRFEEFWSHHPKCYSTIALAWSSTYIGSPRFIFTRKLCSTKLALKQWNRLFFGNIQLQIRSLLSQLDALQQSAHLSTLSSPELGLQQVLDDLLRQEEILWKTKSREQ